MIIKQKAPLKGAIRFRIENRLSLAPFVLLLLYHMPKQNVNGKFFDIKKRGNRLAFCYFFFIFSLPSPKE